MEYVLAVVVLGLVLGMALVAMYDRRMERDREGQRLRDRLLVDVTRSEMRSERLKAEVEERERWLLRWWSLTGEPVPSDRDRQSSNFRVESGSNTLFDAWQDPNLMRMLWTEIEARRTAGAHFTPYSMPSPSPRPRSLGRSPEELRFTRWLEGMRSG